MCGADTCGGSHHDRVKQWLTIMAVQIIFCWSAWRLAPCQSSPLLSSVVVAKSYEIKLI
jgi:hypothetical protein